MGLYLPSKMILRSPPGNRIPMKTAVILTLIFSFVPILCLVKRSLLVFFILLIASQALGLIHEYEFGFKGLFDINSILTILYIFAITVSLRRFGDLRQSNVAKYLLPVLFLYAFGVLYPWIDGSSSLFYSIKASKEFLNYICFFAVFLFLRNENDINAGWKFFILLAIYYSVMEVAGCISNGYIFSFLQYKYRPEQGILTKVYFPIFSIMITSFLLLLYQSLFKKQNKASLILVIVLSIGVLLSFHRAYYLGLCFVVPMILVLNRELKKMLLAVSATVIVLLFSAFFISGLMSKDISDVLDTYMLSPITELYYHKGGHLIGRDIVAKSRWKLASERKWFGYGFLDKESDLGKKLGLKLNKNWIGATELGMVDAGHLDVAIKFGRMGWILLYGSIFLLSIRFIVLMKRSSDLGLKAKLFACAGTLIVFLCVQKTHAPLMRQFGIVPMTIALALVDREYMLKVGKGS